MRPTTPDNRFRLFAAALWMAIAIPPTIASPAAPNSEHGLDLARKLCSNCHRVEAKGSPIHLAHEAADFATIANRRGQTADRLEGYMLAPPHPTMPEIPLAQDEMKDISAYILSLQRP
jgi:mono/diheme cytochrome c family protein